MKLWLDAKREPEVDWVWAKTAHCAIVMLQGGCVEKISFAPDQRKTINQVLDWMIEHESRADRAIHLRTDGAKKPRKLLKLRAASL